MTGINLTDPFSLADVDYRIGATTQDKTRGMLVFYITARAVMDRLDAYTSQHGGTWWTGYAPLADNKHVECQLTVQMPVGEALLAVTRCDVGEPSEGMGDTIKGAYSDALKRAAVQFGIGRYLYGLGETWVPIDAGPGGKGKLTDASHAEARKFYIDRIGAAAEPAGTRPQARQDHADAAEEARPAQPAAATNGHGPARATAADLQAFWPKVRELGYDSAQVQAIAGKPVPDLARAELAELWTKLKDVAAGVAAARKVKA